MIYHRLQAQVIPYLRFRKTVITGNIVALPADTTASPDIIARHHLPPVLHRLRLLRTTTERRNLDALDNRDALVAPSTIHQVTALVLVLIPAPVPVLAITRTGIPVCLQTPLLRFLTVIVEEDLEGRRRVERGRS